MSASLNNSIRLGIEWSRVFLRFMKGVRASYPITTAQLRRLDRLADQTAARRDACTPPRRRAGPWLCPMATLNHLPDAAELDPRPDSGARRVRRAAAPTTRRRPTCAGPGGSTCAPSRSFADAAYAAWKFGDDVDLWATLNEPLVTASQGYVSIPGVTGEGARGAAPDPAAVTALENQGLANSAAYVAVHARCTAVPASGLVHNLVDSAANDPARPEERHRRAARRPDLQLRLPRDRDQRLVRPRRRRRARPRRGAGQPAQQGRLDRRQSLLARASRGAARVRLVDRAAVRLRPPRDLPRRRQPGRPALPDDVHGLRLQIDPAGLRNVVQEVAEHAS